MQHRLQTARDIVNECRDLRDHAARGLRVAQPGRRRAAPLVAAVRTKASGSRCCRSSTPAPTPILPCSPTGLSEEIVTGLSRFSYLRVIARSSTTRYASTSADVRSVGKEIGARYVMEGSLRQAGTQLRVAVQLVETTSGAHLWAETYNRRLDSDELFALAGRPRPANRLDGRRLVWRAATQHE